jgi:hypothetical protein
MNQRPFLFGYTKEALFKRSLPCSSLRPSMTKPGVIARLLPLEQYVPDSRFLSQGYHCFHLEFLGGLARPPARSPRSFVLARRLRSGLKEVMHSTHYTHVLQCNER